MEAFVDITGNKYGRLTVINFSHISKKRTYWNCKCVCGNSKIIDGSTLKIGGCKSCGCYNKEKISQRSLTHGFTVGKRSPEYAAWCHMKERTLNHNICNYLNYGGRGIVVCDRWINSFENFLEDMGIRPSKNHSLDRFPDVNGNYEKSNCRWATSKEQGGNKRNNRWLEYNGESKVLSDWALYFKVSHAAIIYWLKKQSFEKTAERFKKKNK